MKQALLFLLLAVALSLAPGTASAQKTITFSHIINPGVLSSAIVDLSGRSIENPRLNLGEFISSEKCLSDLTAVRTVLGSDSQPLYIDNRASAFSGWTLTIAIDASTATAGPQETIDYNDPGHDGSGCDDYDQDGAGGLIRIDVQDVRLVTLCPYCSDRSILLGATTELDFSQNQTLTLIRSDTPAGRWLLRGIEISQSVPAGLDIDDYSLDLMMTTTAS